MSTLHKQLSNAEQLLEALSDRAQLWEEHEHDHIVLSPETTEQHRQPDVTPPPAGALNGQPDDSALKATTVAHVQQHPQAELVASTPGSPSSRPVSGSERSRHQLLLLQRALCPLSFIHPDRSLTADDLKPHAAPKAKQVYDTLVKGLQQCPWYMLKPGGRARVLWDLLLFFFTTGLVLYVPVLVAFYAPITQCTYWAKDAPDVAPDVVPAPPPSGVTFMTLTNAAFLLDILLNFLTGVVHFNPETSLYETSYDLADVAFTYARTWLVVDVLSCLPLECMVTAGGAMYNYNLGHINRLLKASGLLRRAHGDPFRIINKIPYLKNNFNYSLRLVVVSASALLLGLHYFACALWLVLRVQGFPAQTWPVQLNLSHVSVYEQWTWSVFAVTSAMIGLGYGSFPPVTFPEAVLWIIEMMLMAGGFAVVNGFILSAILEFLSDQARYKARLLRAQKEVEHRRLPSALARRVLSYYELKHSSKNVHLPMEGIMQDLEPSLRLQVALASVGHLLQGLPVLKESQQLLNRVCLLMEPHVAAEGQIIAIPGTQHRYLYIMTQGYADVYLGDLLIDTLVSGDAFGEAALLPVPPQQQLPPRLQALWMNTHSFSCNSWPTMFTVKALSNCSLMILDRQQFMELLHGYPWARDQLHQLGRDYAQVLEELPMLDDLWHRASAFDPLTDAAALVPDAQKKPLQKAAASIKSGLGRPGWWRGSTQDPS